MYFSKEQINFLMNKVVSAYKHNKLPKSGMSNFILSFGEYLKQGEGIESGLIENVCPKCLGTGKKEV